MTAFDGCESSLAIPRRLGKPQIPAPWNAWTASKRLRPGGNSLILGWQRSFCPLSRSIPSIFPAVLSRIQIQDCVWILVLGPECLSSGYSVYDPLPDASTPVCDALRLFRSFAVGTLAESLRIHLLSFSSY